MLTFILSVIAGFSTPYVEPTVTKLLKSKMNNMPVHEGEYRTITFVSLLVSVAIAAIVSGLLASAFTVLFGGAIGLFGVRLFQAGKLFMDGKYNNLDED